MQKVILMSQCEHDELNMRFSNQLTELNEQLEILKKENRSLKEQRTYLLNEISKLKKVTEQLEK